MATLEEAHSPGWRKPSEVMRQRKKKKTKNPQTSIGGDSSNAEKPSKSGTSSLRPGVTSKRRNPFGCGDGVSARRRISCEEGTGDGHGYAQKEANVETEKVEMEQTTSSAEPAINGGEELTATDLSEEELKCDNTVESPGPTEEQSRHRSSLCPIDWCLHTRIRFMSQASFDWSDRISSEEEGHGITNFVRCKFSEQDASQGGSLSEETVYRQRLKQSTMVWSSPSLPWFKIFPRIVPESRDAKTSFLVKEKNVQEAMMSQWCESFCSVYQLLRVGICPYFYVCAHRLTVLFRAKRVAGRDSVHAFLGPTTRGLRESLKADGVIFTMPLLKDESVKYQDPYQVIDEVADKTQHGPISPSGDEKSKPRDDEEPDHESDVASWLESIGLENFLDVNSHRVNLEADPSVKQDNRPQSVLFVEGPSDVQALYNFILNYKNIVVTVGAQAGIPPSILAPLAFHGATLTSAKIKPGRMRQAVGQSVREVHTLQVSGPILPHNVDLLAGLLSEAQQGRFSATFQAHEPTAAFTAASHRISPGPREAEVPPPPPGPGHGSFSRGFAEKLYGPVAALQKPWKELEYSAGEYEWT